ncbi:ABC transporter ATP-binding protein [Hazenella sp. IB182357]|uniref:ABC transporter ATP-binding protein n=1 Tax=Polycladospora coralii TaxID=2771432 RepID=A0A926NAP0_9BACL|nr:ABC transporter ATP-binding protein [Polycladospora coralii]MBD1373386.1 ABC transporter ATP-binding protein [Polycladospora coralii]MBS7531616.1 ABC transporter ATP-binding protein [Polycladospora coralii]
MIEADGVWKVFGSGESKVEALRGIHLNIESGEMLAIMGPSGCGKTSLLNCLSGLDSVSSGVVKVDGITLSDLNEVDRDQLRSNKMGFVFQSYNLLSVLTAQENVELPLLIQGIKRKEAKEKASEILKRVGLYKRKNHLPTQLSGGQAQRVALARALITQPSVIWADEPTGALDRSTSNMIMDLFLQMNRTERTSMVIVTHDPQIARQCDRVLYMDSGLIVDEQYGRED